MRTAHVFAARGGGRHGRSIACRARIQADIVADQIRAQGSIRTPRKAPSKTCEPQKPDEAVWILRCESGSYRVKLRPRHGGNGQRINETQDNGRSGVSATR